MSEHIAIVDDDASVRRALGRLLEANSFRVRCYASARTFLQSLDAGAPACLITDLRMPGMTGLELLQRIASMGLNIPTIVITANDEPGLRHRSALAGATAFLVKPLDLCALLDAIKAATKKANGQPNPANKV